MAIPEIRIKEVNALAGVFAHHQAARQENALVVIVTHSKTKDSAEGCGALGHLNPDHAEHGVGEIYSGLRAHGIDPDEYFGMDEGSLATAVKKVGFETDSKERAARLLEESKAQNIPIICASFGHEDGSVAIVGTWNLDRLDRNNPIEVTGALCSDARVPSEALSSAARCALESKKTCTFPELVARNAKVQSPSEILVYGKGTVVPDNRSGDVFKVVVDPQKGADILSKVSLAYAIASFGPCGNGPKSLVKIRFYKAGDKAAAEFRKHFSGAKGIKID